MPDCAKTSTDHWVRSGSAHGAAKPAVKLRVANYRSLRTSSLTETPGTCHKRSRHLVCKLDQISCRAAGKGAASDGAVGINPASAGQKPRTAGPPAAGVQAGASRVAHSQPSCLAAGKIFHLTKISPDKRAAPPGAPGQRGASGPFHDGRPGAAEGRSLPAPGLRRRGSANGPQRRNCPVRPRRGSPEPPARPGRCRHPRPAVPEGAADESGSALLARRRPPPPPFLPSRRRDFRRPL